MIYKSDLKRDFAAGVYLSEVQNPITPPPLHTVNVNIHTGKGGELNQRVGETSNRGEYRSQSWVQVNFLDDDIFAVTSMSLIFLRPRAYAYSGVSSGEITRVQLRDKAMWGACSPTPSTSSPAAPQSSGSSSSTYYRCSSSPYNILQVLFLPI